MYAYRETLILTDPQRLMLRQPLPLPLGQAVEILITFDKVSPLPPAEVSAPNSWTAFLNQQDDLRAKHPEEVKDFTLTRAPLEMPNYREPFAGWLE